MLRRCHKEQGIDTNTRIDLQYILSLKIMYQPERKMIISGNGFFRIDVVLRYDPVDIRKGIKAIGRINYIGNQIIGEW
jgi:hypothetical protein